MSQAAGGACIPAGLTYGLHTLPLREKHMRELQMVATCQLRAVAKSQSHLNHETTDALPARLKVPTLDAALTAARARYYFIKGHSSTYADLVSSNPLNLPLLIHRFISYAPSVPRLARPSHRLLRAHQSVAHHIRASTRVNESRFV